MGRVVREDLDTRARNLARADPQGSAARETRPVNRASPTFRIRATGCGGQRERPREDTPWPIRWRREKSHHRRRRHGANRPRIGLPVRTERSRTRRREPSDEATNGKRGEAAARRTRCRRGTNLRRASTRANRHSFRGGTLSAREGEHRRTTSDQPREPQIRCRLRNAGGRERRKPPRWNRTTGAERVGRMAPSRRCRGADRGNAVHVEAGVDVPGETRKRGPEGRKFQERKGRRREIGGCPTDPARTPETT